MMKLLTSTAVYLGANAVGMLLAIILLPGFTITPTGFIVAVAIFSIIQSVGGPMVTKMSLKKLPQLMGGIALVVIFFGLFITQLLVPGMSMGGIANWLAATLLVWIGSLTASILLPLYVFKEVVENAKEATDRKIEEQVRKQVEEQTRSEAQIRKDVEQKVRGEVEQQVRGEVEQQVRGEMEQQVRAEVEEKVRNEAAAAAPTPSTPPAGSGQ